MLGALYNIETHYYPHTNGEIEAQKRGVLCQTAHDLEVL